MTDAVESGGFVCELRGKIADAASAVAKAHWMTPLRLSACEVYVPSLGLCWDLERHSGDGRFVRRSCAPTCEVRTMWVGTQRRLGVWAMGSLQPGTEVTIGWDRPWHTLTCHVTCACGLSSCAVRHWYQERSVLAHSLPVVHERVGTRREDPVRTKKGKLAELETTLNPFPSSPADKPSREERKLQQVLKAFEKLEKKERTQRHVNTSPHPRSDLSPSLLPSLSLSLLGLPRVARALPVTCWAPIPRSTRSLLLLPLLLVLPPLLLRALPHFFPRVLMRRRGRQVPWSPPPRSPLLPLHTRHPISKSAAHRCC